VKPPERQVDGQVLTSKSLPAARITLDSHYRYVGGQRFDLYGVAEAEQHMFVEKSAQGSVQRFYWLQFEHYLPSNQHTYQYPPAGTLEINGLPFIADAKIYADYSHLNSNPASDGAFMQRMLEQHGLKFPKAAIRLRMFYSPDDTHRSEVMIIYGEALKPEELPRGSEAGVSAEEQAPELARRVAEHAKAGIRIERQAVPKSAR
jgi:hypothetical protein